MRVLIIEDEPKLAGLLRKGLTVQEFALLDALMRRPGQAVSRYDRWSPTRTSPRSSGRTAPWSRPAHTRMWHC